MCSYFAISGIHTGVEKQHMISYIIKYMIKRQSMGKAGQGYGLKGT